ncbi:MAG TPA: hypothetical protein VIM48_04000, partial [Chthoniobacterales bacterium]
MRGAARYFTGLVCGFLAIAAIWFGLFVASFGYYGNYGDRNVVAWFRNKSEILLARMGHPKIVLAGGSNVLYGLDAATIQRTFGVTCVNFGTHAALPFHYLVHRWKGSLRPGDLLIISPEHRFLERDPDDMNEVFVGYMLAGDPRYFWQMSFPNQIDAILTVDFRRLMMPLFTSLSENQREADVQLSWLRACFLDAQGDYIANSSEAANKAELEKLLRSKAADVLANGYLLDNATRDSLYWRLISDLAEWARRRRVRIVYAAPSVLNLPEVTSDAFRKYFAAMEAHYRALGIPVLIKQEDNIYPESLMFDSVYH